MKMVLFFSAVVLLPVLGACSPRPMPRAEAQAISSTPSVLEAERQLQQVLRQANRGYASTGEVLEAQQAVQAARLQAGAAAEAARR